MENLLSKQERNSLLKIQNDISKEEIVKYYTLSSKDIEIIKRHRGENNRIGFAVQIGVLRHKGWTLSNYDEFPIQVLEYIGSQINISSSEFKNYFNRQNTVFDHQKEIREIFGYKLFREEGFLQDIDKIMEQYITKSNDPFYLVSMLIAELKKRMILLPGITVLEEIVFKLVLKAEETAISEINFHISGVQRGNLDSLLETIEKDKQPALTWIRNISGKSTPEELLEILKRIDKIESLKLNIVTLKVPNYIIEQYIKLGYRYDPYSLKRFDNKKRYAILALLLRDLHQELIDRVINIHDIKINAAFSSIRKKHEHSLKENKKITATIIDDYVEIGDKIEQSVADIGINSNDEDKTVKFTISSKDFEKLKKSIETAKKLKESVKTDSILMIERYYNTFRKYSPTLLKSLSFKATNSPCKKIMDAVNIVNDLNTTKKTNLPEDVDISFTNKKWQAIIKKKTGSEKRHFFEMAVLNELRNRIRSGDISVEGSKSYRDFEDYLVSKEKWQIEKYSTRLSAPLSVDEYLQIQEKKLDNLLKLYSKNYDKYGEVIGEDNKLHPKRVEKTTPEEAKELSIELYKLVPNINLQDLLYEVSKLAGFEKYFLNLATNKEINSKEELMILIFSIMGIGTNVGLSNIAASLTNVSHKQLAYAADWRLLDGNLYRAISSLVDLQMKEPISDWWGDGSTSSSDGMRLVTIVDALNASSNPHFGFEKGLTIYRFVNDKYAAFYSIVTNTNVRDAIHVIDGILKYASEIKIQEHYTDTAGYTDQIFALMSIMGFRFAPRLRNLPDLKLYSIDKNKYPNLKDLIPGMINKELIKENYDTVMRLSHSIFEGKVSSAAVLGKLGSYARNNSLANTLKEMGRIEKTIFILEYAADPTLRKRIQAGLNKGEAMNNMARNVFFGRKGNLWEHEFQAQFQKASCLDLILTSIVLWNTKYLSKAWKYYKQKNLNANELLLKHVSPLNWDHINFLGKYSMEFDTEFEEDNLRKLNT